MLPTINVLPVWSLSLQHSYLILAPLAVVVVYDVTNKDSYDAAVNDWYQEAKAASPSSIFVLVGNKSDASAERVIQTSEAQEHATKLGFKHFIECSAKDDGNIALIFETICAGMYSQCFLLIIIEDLPPSTAEHYAQ